MWGFKRQLLWGIRASFRTYSYVPLENSARRFKCKSRERESNFKRTIMNESLQQDNNDDGVRRVNFASTKNLVVKSTMFPHRNIHKYTWTSHDETTHNHIDYILIERRWHSSILDVQSFRGDDWVTDHYLMVSKVREVMAVS